MVIVENKKLNSILLVAIAVIINKLFRNADSRRTRETIEPKSKYKYLLNEPFSRRLSTFIIVYGYCYCY